VTSGFSAAEQAVSTSTTFVEHVIRFQVAGVLGGKIRVAVGSASGFADLFPETELGIGYHTISLQVNASPYYLVFRNYLAEAMAIDNVEVLDNVPVELVHSYTESQLQDIRILQTADVLYLFHPSLATRKIERRGDRIWSIVDVPWIDGPYNEQNEGFDVSLVQLVKNPDFADGIKDWDSDGSDPDAEVEWDSSQRLAILRSGDAGAEPAIIEQNVATGISSSTVFVLHFRIVGSSGTNQVNGSVGTTSGGVDIVAATEYEQGWHSIKITSSATNFYIRFTIDGASGHIFVGGLGGVFLYRTNARLLELSGVEGDVTCQAYGFEPFAATDVGRILRLTWPGKEPTWGVITAFTDTDFTADLKAITQPVLVMHGEDDQVAPLETTGRQAVKLLKDGTLKTYPGFPHGMATTHADVINADILAFIRS
jgi:hypothetical protein